MAAYDAPLPVVLDAIRDVAMTRFHGVAVSPLARMVWTDWQWTYGSPEQAFLHAQGIGDHDRGSRLWRVDVAVTSERPWRIKVTPHSASFAEDNAIRRGADGKNVDSARLQRYADALLAQVHARLRPFAVQALAPSATSDELPPKELARPAIELDNSERHIDRYRVDGLSPQFAFVEGATIDATSGAVVGGVVVTVSISGRLDVLQTVSDETGYYRFDNLQPGTYTVSAYYSVTHRGQIEVRRSNIEVTKGRIAIVPLVVDMQRP